LLADYLAGLIALDTLGAPVPACNEARWIEHEDGVVLDGFHQQVEGIRGYISGGSRILRQLISPITCIVPVSPAF
jgi:hypothetical protein